MATIRPGRMDLVDEDSALEGLLDFLKANRGFDFTGYKRTSLARRIRRRMDGLTIEDFDSYRMFLEANPDEFGVLFNNVLINVTSFFRDSEAWGFLAESVLPKLLDDTHRKAQVRVWSAGCASGEEPFSIAMLLAEAMGIDDYCRRAKVYATDWDEEALTQARRARYTVEQLEAVPEALRQKYFAVEDGGGTFHGALRRSVIFGRHDLVDDSPISRLDLLLCRNTLMYFNVATQARILSRLHFALGDNGYLFLGRAEMLLSHTRDFTPVDLKHRVFSKVRDDSVPDLRHGPALSRPERSTTSVNDYTRLREVALDAGPVAQVILDAGGRLAVFNDRAASMFQLGAPELGKPLQDLELSYRPVDLRSMIDQAREASGGTASSSVSRVLKTGDAQYLDVTVRCLYDNADLVATSITFDDVTKHQKLQENLQQFSENLETAYEELQSANEELETTNEELQSSNEELETTNEELQAANEEMETINEELRSTNEELQTANEALREREDDLHRANSFLNAILSSLRAGVAVVTKDGRIKVWNERAAELWGVRADEVKETLLGELDIGLPVRMLQEPMNEALASSQPRDLVLDAVNRRGRAIRCHITINPLHPPEPETLTLLMDVLDPESP